MREARGGRGGRGGEEAGGKDAGCRRGWRREGRNGTKEAERESESESERERSRGLAEEINNGLGNPRSVVHTGGKLPTIPDNGEKEERWSRRRGW